GRRGSSCRRRPRPRPRPRAPAIRPTLRRWRGVSHEPELGIKGRMARPPERRQPVQCPLGAADSVDMAEMGLRRGTSATAKIALLIGAPMAVFALLLLIPHLDVLLMSPDFHVVIVSSIAACALFIAIVAGLSAVRSGNTPVLLVALGVPRHGRGD